MESFNATDDNRQKLGWIYAKMAQKNMKKKKKKSTYLIENSIVYFPFPILMNQIQLHQSTDT